LEPGVSLKSFGLHQLDAIALEIQANSLIKSTI
jgi:hypothetical protein